ncbi:MULTISPECIES: glycosyltransferase [Lonsdalea]|uniref:Glycosyl transferase family 1 n=2 Tax=Lonsdalea TaxID=1082702 RepID=A0ACD1JBH5_9GAMM|nr:MULTISPECIES: glycosyltransferase [Lonsdalea]OSN00434.1 glycosyl transferase family 1 [Lonsdalea populi]QPQ23618.1 glycosyltransferase [Lonsdalea populi]RAT13181.1 glycosyl transferase family 1 [Lonsdalea quercina]RAT19963.1 glycosyl transferase family 1 [Lonsdalea populi]RAT20306.1 glycosyl transferase family 1 [Lonsdalea populi]
MVDSLELDRSEIPESCILFATADWDEPYWTNKQHCAKALAELGVEVLYIESVGLRAPRPASHRDWQRLRERLLKGLRSLFVGAPRRAPHIRVLSPLLIPAGYRYGVTRWLNRWLLKAAIWRNLPRQIKSPPLVWTYHPFMLDLFASLKGSALLYHCVDDLAAVPGVDARAFRCAEEQLLHQAKAVFATAPALAERCRQLNDNTYFMSNVVDAVHFGNGLKQGKIPDDLACIQEPRLGYHGVLSDFKIDFQLLLSVARMRPDWHWVFIGAEREGQKSALVAELQTLPNVHFLGYRRYEVLPDYLRGIQVGLLPSLINEYTDSMFPMKYFEYLAAGIPVVSTPLSFSRTISEGMLTADTAEGFVNAIEQQLTRGRFDQKEVDVLVGDNTWSGRLSKMLKALNGMPK